MAGANGNPNKPSIHTYAKEGIEKKLSSILNSHFVVKMKGS
jgi:hypothetical protein